MRNTITALYDAVPADVEGGALSSDVGPLLLNGIDCQINLTKRLSAALTDRRHASDVTHWQHDILTQRV